MLELESLNADGNKNSIKYWERFVLVERSLLNRVVITLAIAAAGFGIVALAYLRTGSYFPSITIVTIAFITLFSGLYLGLFFGISVTLLVDYFFIPPVGTILENSFAKEHFIIAVVLVGVVISVLISKLRESYCRTTQMRWDAERSRRELQREYKLVETIVENMPIPLFLKDANDNFRIKTWNKAAEDLFGLPKEVAIGKSAEDLFSVEYADRYRADDLRVTSAGIRVDIPEEPSYSKVLGDIILRTTKVPILLGPDNQLKFLLGICENITERKANEKALTEAKKAAEVANLAKSAFLANMSHEIRTPLGAIMGFSELLADSRVAPGEKSKFIASIIRNGELLTNIINDILDLSKVEAGKLEVNLREVALAEIFTDTNSLLELQAREKGIALKITVEDDVPTVIRTDPLRLRQILINIVGNAIKFTAKGSVEVFVQRGHDPSGRDGISFVVKDSGKGIEKGQIAKLFAPFSQVHVDAARTYGGTGLGLVLSKRLANLLGGDVVLTQTEVNRGSIFTVTIDPGPLGQIFRGEFRPPASDARWIQESQCLSGIKVLLAEDTVDNQILVSRMLSLAGASVECVSNGREALDRVLHSTFDVLLMDLQMPVMNGYEAIVEMRRRGYRGKIAALTAHALSSEKGRCLESGFDSYLCKPVNRGALIEEVRKLAREKDSISHRNFS
ncbi:MAG: hypothetical protein C5B49_09770 [Bdellovibrio sp.]|nr:MAG: hypothetical protein C5B49_09770 [Bdellovibrio sp.]